MEIRSSSGPLNEYFPESHICATPDGRGNGNCCPEDEVKSPVVVSKRSRKDGILNMRKSLAWNPAFFTEEGVLDSSELPIITDSVTKSSCKLLSKTDLKGSSMVQFDKFSKRPPLNNLNDFFLSKVHSGSMSRRSSNKMAANLLSISEASKHDGPKLSMSLRKTPSSKIITRNVRKLNVACLMLEKERTSKVQPEKDSTLLKLNSYPSSSNRSQGEMSSALIDMARLVKEKAQIFRGLPFSPIQAKQSSLRMPSSHGGLGVFEKDPILLKLNSCPSSSTKSPIDTTCSGSAGISPSISQQTLNVPGLPPAPIQAKPSALRVPSPSHGFFQQKMATSSHTDRLRRTSQALVSNTPSQRKPAKLKRIAPSKPPVAQTEQQPKNCSKSQNSSKPLAVGSRVIGEARHFNDFENTSGYSQCSGGSIVTENCPTSSEMRFSQNLAESNSKPLELVTRKDEGDRTYADTCLEELHCISAGFRASEEAGLCIEPRGEPTEGRSVQNGEENFHRTRSKVRRTISGKLQTGEEHANSSRDVQLAASEECQPLDDLQLCRPRNEASSAEENGLMPAKKISLDNLKQEAVLLKHHLSAVPYSEEWLAAIEAFGEDILEVKTGTVLNSPPGKDIPEPSPWSPVKRKAQDVGPFDCTKYTIKPFPWEE